MRSLILTFLFFTSVFLLFGQSTTNGGHANHWCFGDSVALNFNNNTINFLPNSSVRSRGGAMTHSDKNGNLLFYGNTTEIRDASHNLMQNGDLLTNVFVNNPGYYYEYYLYYLKCSFVVPRPCHPNQYYFIYVHPDTSIWNNNYNYYGHLDSVQLKYSLIDMNLNNGLGGVVPGQKNIIIDPAYTSPMVAVTKHANNMDYWVATVKNGTNQYKSYQITSTGIISIPVISTSPSVFYRSPFGGNRSGQMDFSNSGNKLAITNNKALNTYHNGWPVANPPAFELMDFNKATGQFSNNITLDFDSLFYRWYVYPNSNQPYNQGTSLMSVEFSPDDQTLYAATLTAIIQYDLSSNNNAIIPSAWNIVSSSFYYLGNTYYSYNYALQNGPNGKLYCGSMHYGGISVPNYGSNISIINSPNTFGAGCGYQPFVYQTYPQFHYSFPNFVSDFIYQRQLSDTIACANISNSFSLIDTFSIDSTIWDFGDTTVFDTVYSLPINHTYNNAGQYPVTVYLYSGCVIDTILDTVDVYFVPLADLGPDTILCEGDSLAFQLIDTTSSYLWSTGDTTSYLRILQSDTYSVEVSTMYCGSYADTVVIDSLIPALIHLPSDSILCIGDTLQLDAAVEQGSYLWSTGDTSAQINITSSGVYTVTSSNLCGTDQDTSQITFITVPNFSLGNDSVLCINDTVFLSAYDTLTNYYWYNGNTGAYDTITSSGVYWVNDSNLCGQKSDTVQFWFLNPDTVDLGSDTTLCTNQYIWLMDTTSFGSYTWSTGQITDSIMVTTEGTYALTTNNACGVASDSIVVTYEEIPNISLGSDIDSCITNPANLSVYWDNASYIWQNGSTNNTIFASQEGIYSVTVTNICGSDSDRVEVNYVSPISFELGDDTIICESDVFVMDVTTNDATYLWNTGDTTAVYTVQRPGLYAVTITNLCGEVSDELRVIVDSIPKVNLPSDTLVCENTPVEVYLSEKHSYGVEWSTGSSSNPITFHDSGAYSVRIWNRCGETTDALQVMYQPNPTVELGSDTLICLGETINLSPKNISDGIVSYSWSTGTEDRSILVTEGGAYALTVTDSLGCESWDDIHVQDCGVSLFIPNAFTPNSDGVNDIFKVEGYGFTEFELTVYNRWGETVFVSTQVENGWDGTYANQNSEIGVYTYKVSIKAEGSYNKDLFGQITLIR